MRIAFVLSTCQRSGPFIVASDIVNNINLEHNHIDVFFIKDSKVEISFKCNGLIKVKLFKKHDLSTYDIVHSHGFLGDLHTYCNKNSINGKWISTLHQKIQIDYGMRYGKLIGYFLEILWCKILGYCHIVILLTKEMQLYYESKLNTKLHFVHNGVSGEATENGIPNQDLQKLVSFKEKYTVLGISANLIYRKGIDRVIELLALPEAKHFGLIVLGDGPLKSELNSMAKKLNVDDRCLFLGFKKNALDYYKIFDVYVMSSRSEGFGLCVIEAASQKIPIVCNQLSVFDELFEKDEVLRFQLDDETSMLRAIFKTIQHKERYSELVYKRFIKNYTSKTMAEQYINVYASALNRSQ